MSRTTEADVSYKTNHNCADKREELRRAHSRRENGSECASVGVKELCQE